MRFVTGAELRSVLHHRMLMERLRQAFRGGVESAPETRLHLDVRTAHDADLRIEPVWRPGQSIGVRVAGFFPDNAALDVHPAQGVFLLLDGKTGLPRAAIDGPALARRRAAVASVLAATYLARNDAERLLVAGTGPLALEVIEAYTAVLPIKHVLVWGRRFERAKKLAARFHRPKFRIEATDDLEGAVRGAQIIACATAAREPIIKGAWLTEGAHLDLLGGSGPDMREADDDAVRRCRVFVDSRSGGCMETGDIAGPLSAGALQAQDIAGDLFELSRGEKAGRRFYDQITLFKSAGAPLEDLTAAEIAVEMVIHNEIIR
jgi:ornithine cyclodeaminase/alanine dehydrogenase-like protein (mu-crystallin family)